MDAHEACGPSAQYASYIEGMAKKTTYLIANQTTGTNHEFSNKQEFLAFIGYIASEHPEEILTISFSVSN
jgi:hypothetical protein